MKTLSLSVLLLSLLIFLPEKGSAQNIPVFDKTPRVVVQGQGKVLLPADRARLEIGVVTEARSAGSASARNAKKLQATLKSLREVLGKRGEIKTAGYSVLPQYQPPRDTGKPKISGYSASSAVIVITDDLKLIGELIDAAAESGANRIRKLEFILQNEEKARLQALKIAAKEARGKAEAVAGALGQRVKKIVLAEEREEGGGPFRSRVAAFSGESVSTPIEPGTVEVESVIQLTAEIGD